MKKIILILGIILVSVLGFSQTKNINSAGSNLVKKDTDGNVVITGDVYLDATKKLILANDADDHTYIHESSADVYQEVVGGVVITQITETGDDLIELLNADVEIDSSLAVGVDLTVAGTAIVDGSLVSDGYNFAADAEASDAYVITLAPAPDGLVVGMMFTFTANTANTDGATFNPNSFGAQAILKMHDQALVTGDIEAGQVVVVVWDGANYQMTSQIAQ